MIGIRWLEFSPVTNGRCRLAFSGNVIGSRITDVPGGGEGATTRPTKGVHHQVAAPTAKEYHRQGNAKVFEPSGKLFIHGSQPRWRLPPPTNMPANRP